ncbi:hypothetical protein ACFQZI_11160 [Mucilaginibacter lutimaris]|uniref:Uncharacterized protein n=1 Tax=Mucilaginibacter lutimaris TaxID=931629 RepID=A0ABW2ZGY1_9SPHI
MNNLFENISWENYLFFTGTLGIATYALIGWKYYRKEITKIIGRLSGMQADSKDIPAALQYQAPESADKAIPDRPTFPEEIIWKPDNFSVEVRELAKRLLSCINEATGKPYDPSALIPRLKYILNDFPEVAASREREDINAFIVRECENTGTALLSDSEVDRWWSA